MLLKVDILKLWTLILPQDIKNIFHIGLNLSFAKFPIYSVGEVNKLGKI